MNDPIIGHTQILEFFEKTISAGNLSHAYCLVGPEHVGKRAVAEYISGKILGVPVEKLSTQPDMVLVEQEIDEKTGKTKMNIDAGQIRDLRLFLSQKSFLGGLKITIIDNAEKMNETSSNILLKTLEEPKGKSVIFLITKDEDLLPQTIQSRCQMINFHPVLREEIKTGIEKKGVDSKIAEEMARMSSGLPGKVVNWLENEEEYQQHKQELIRFISLFNKSFHDKLEKIDELFGDKTDHIASREGLQKILDIWLGVMRGFLHTNNGLREGKLKIQLDNKKLLKITGLIQDAKIFLTQNIHPRLLVEQILLEMP